MDSPVISIIKQIIQIDKNNTTAVYIQIAQQFIDAIQRSYLSQGEKLPGTRVLSNLLQVHRNTAVAAYDELASQGWLEIIPNKGTYILIPLPKQSRIKAGSSQILQENSYPKKAGFPFKNAFHLASTNEMATVKYSLNDGQPDLRLHPIHQFSKWYSAAMKRKSLLSKWNNSKSYSPYTLQLCNYLNTTRRFTVRSTNLVGTRSTEMSLYIVAQLLIKPNDIVLVGRLSNYAANMIFQQSGANIKTIPIDENGLDIDFVKQFLLKNKVRCIYVCSNRDYPTTYTLSAERRLQLLHLAKSHKFAIIEDDYDYDFQYEGSAILPMASSDADGLVIYLGKMGQSLFPSFQTGFVVAPENIITEAKNYLQIIDKQGDLIQEQLLAELIYEGEIHRLLKKNILIYKKRLEFVSSCLHRYFDQSIRFKKPNGGLAIWVSFEPKISLAKLAKKTKEVDLFMPQTILYQDRNTCAIRLGFGHLNEDEIEIVVQKLKFAYNAVIQSK